MHICTTDSVSGKKVERQLGLVQGIAMRNPAVKGGLKGILKILTTGSNKFYGQACAVTRQQALNNMIEEAEAMGANAIVAVRFQTSTYYEHLSEVTVYGTAIVVENL